ncbi:MAG: 3-deoxy-D-manno-octulosonic acid transferase [Nitrospirae bacterium]|nr:3-deoxy-D-manno-octulosonic acid transferase [Nitrospirota bacterium]
MLLLYDFLSALAVLIYSPLLCLKKGPENRTVFVAERLGLSGYDKTDVWVHAVSVGEVMACVPFLKALKKEFPEKRITLSTTTYTGQKVARDSFHEADRIMYMPLDAGLIMRRVVGLLRPEIFITVETELWPALFRALKQRGCRIVVLNGRISIRSFTGYKRFDFFMKKVLSYVDFFYMQGRGDAERVTEIGADRHKVGVMGNFKFDITFASAKRQDWVELISSRVLLAASTHRGEEDIILEAFESVRRFCPDIRLIIAPRHPERFDEVAEMLKKRGLKFIRRTEIRSKEQRAKGKGHGLQITDHGVYDVILLDTIGELSQVFSIATIAFIGGSLVPVGGHNILEPAYWGRPIIFGPHMDNFPFAADFLEGRAAVRVADAKDVEAAVKGLLMDGDEAARMGQRARAMVEKNTGAVKKAIELVRGFIGTA